jgi:hypothetical protein
MQGLDASRSTYDPRTAYLELRVGASQALELEETSIAMSLARISLASVTASSTCLSNFQQWLRPLGFLSVVLVLDPYLETVQTPKCDRGR